MSGSKGWFLDEFKVVLLRRRQGVFGMRLWVTQIFAFINNANWLEASGLILRSCSFWRRNRLKSIIVRYSRYAYIYMYVEQAINGEIVSHKQNWCQGNIYKVNSVHLQGLGCFQMSCLRPPLGPHESPTWSLVHWLNSLGTFAA